MSLTTYIKVIEIGEVALNLKFYRTIDKKLQETQFGFRAGRGTMDAMYVLNYIINKELRKKEGKIFMFFADLKAAFDKMDRKKLNERMEKMGVEDHLRRRIMETYRETINIMKVGDKKTKAFWTEKGMRQGFPMSPLLFNIYVADLEDEMRKEHTGGVTIGKEKFWTMTYADDMALLAKSEKELKGMLKRFKKYLEKRELVLSPEKSKIMVFENGRERKKKREWKWGKESIEEVKEIKYLGYIMQKNGRAEKQVMERFKRVMIAMKKTWSIGERLFKNDYRRRAKMFDALVGSVALYGAEIWEWKNESRLDRNKRKSNEY